MCNGERLDGDVSGTARGTANPSQAAVALFEVQQLKAEVAKLKRDVQLLMGVRRVHWWSAK